MTDSPPSLRIAVLCRGHFFDAWEADCLKEVMSVPGVEIVLLIAEEENKSPKPSFAKKIKNYPYRNLFWRIYKRFRLKTHYFESVSLKQELKDIPLITCKPELKGKFSQHFSSNDIETIRSHRPDIILRFAFNILRGEILTVAKYGVWSYHHSDEQVIRGGPPAFWEIYKKHAVTGAILQRLTEKLDAGIVLRKGYFQTISRSYKANLEQLIAGTIPWMKQAIIDILNDVPFASYPSNSLVPIYFYPTNVQLFRAWRICKTAKRKFHWQELFCPEQWNIGIIKQPIAEFISVETPAKINWLPEPESNEYYADPFGWEAEGELKIVFEQYSYKKQKGILSISDQAGNIKPLLEAKVHLSYPFVVERSDSKGYNRIILPEASQSNSIFCFDSANPKNGKVLLQNVPAIDSTPVFYNDRWWIFCTHEGLFNNTSLYIYHSMEFDGPWIPHKNNPVKNDVRSARPGGTPFVVNNQLFRPAQDCSESYGEAIILNKVTELTENSFAEIPNSRIDPEESWKYNKGLHTLSVAGDYILIDAKRYRFNFDNFRHVLARKIKRLFSK